MDQRLAETLVFDAIEIANRQLPAARRLPRSADAILAGAGGSLDSLGIINFVHALEQRIEEATGRQVALLDPSLLVDDGPFRTAGALSAYLSTLP